MAIFYAYVYRDPSRNSEPFYVGKGSRVRALGHHRRTDRHPFVQRLQKMLREEVQPDIELIKAIDEEHAYFLEKCLVEIFGRKDLGKGTLLNLSDGGRGPIGKRLSDATKQRLSEVQRGKKLTPEHRQKIGASMIGKVQSIEKGQKISASKKGKRNSAAHNAALSAAIKGKPWSEARRAAQRSA
jgi:hypothetical protein